MNKYSSFILSLFLLGISSCAKLPIDAAYQHLQVTHSSDSTTFAVIGDYGQDSPEEGRVAQMVKSWNPEFVVTVGDNNYPLGAAGTIVNNVGKHYGDFIYNPDAPADRVCTGKAAQEKTNRFFPTPGNHDNYTPPSLKAYLDYFTLPGDERNYDFVWGPIHFFSLNSGSGLSGKISPEKKQWLKEKLAQSNEPFKVVYFHHPPYSPGSHGSSTDTQMPFADWGADAVLAGHDHFYVRISENASPKPLYLIIGNSGNERLANCNANPLDASKLTMNYCDADNFGAIKVKAALNQLVFEYYTVDSPQTPKDIFVINK